LSTPIFVGPWYVGRHSVQAVPDDAGKDTGTASWLLPENGIPSGPPIPEGLCRRGPRSRRRPQIAGQLRLKDESRKDDPAGDESSRVEEAEIGLARAVRISQEINRHDPAVACGDGHERERRDIKGHDDWLPRV
jgi:hypothetical protein